MKRFLPTTLALLLVMGSLGHVFAAMFCPRMSGHDCCLKVARHESHRAGIHEHMHGMDMDGMSEASAMDGREMPDMPNIVADVANRDSHATEEMPQMATASGFVLANKLGPPEEACSHCLGHLGFPNAPITSASGADQTNKGFRVVTSSVSKFLVGPSLTLERIGLPEEHAPPVALVPRYVLINLFLI